MLSTSLLTVSCTSDTKAIENVVTEFVNSYKNQQFSSCLDYLSNRLRNSEGDQSLLNKLQEKRLFTGTSTIDKIEITSITKTRATVRVELVGHLNLKSSIELSLIKEEGLWKINNF
jgi:flagellar capping protein FliD